MHVGHLQGCHLQKYFLTPGIWGIFPSSRVVIFCKFICKTAHRRFSVKPWMDVIIDFLIIVINVIPGATTWDTNSQFLSHSVWPSLPLILKQNHMTTFCQHNLLTQWYFHMYYPQVWIINDTCLPYLIQTQQYILHPISPAPGDVLKWNRFWWLATSRTQPDIAKFALEAL